MHMYIYIYMHIYIYIYIHTYMYTYIYRERERYRSCRSCFRRSSAPSRACLSSTRAASVVIRIKRNM